MDLFQIDYIWVFLILLPFVSFMYSSVGHGGASGYLAMMTLFGFAPVVMKPTALLLNLFVAAIAFVHYWRAGHFNIKLFLSFAASSIPLAYIGGYTEVDGFYYKIILGVFLVFAILRMLNIIGKESQSTNETNIWQGLLVGGVFFWFGRNRWWNHSYACYPTDALGQYEAGSCSFSFVHMGKLCSWFVGSAE